MIWNSAPEPVSCRTLMSAPRSISAPKPLHFLGTEGFDVYNISVPFECNGKTYLAGRVEKRDNELSFVRLFEKTDEDTYTAVLPEMTFARMQDPFVTRIGGEIILGGVQIVTHPLDDSRIISWHTLFFRGETPADLRLFAQGPARMKDIRLCELPDHRIAVFSRPQGKKGGLGRIGFTVIDTLRDLCAENILEASVDSSFFPPDEWGGANDVHLLPDGNLGVMGHWAYKENGKLHYQAMAFVLDPLTGRHTAAKIVACRSDISASPACKRPDLYDVLFTGGIVRRENGEAELYTGVSDCEAWRAMIPDPFLAFED